MQQTYNIGFIGVGAMGFGMASNLIDAGHTLRVIAHKKRENVDKLVQRGAIETQTYTDLAENCEILMVCVSESRIVEQIIQEILPSLSGNHMVIDMGTSLPTTTERLYKQLKHHGIDFAESPVAGGAAQAMAGELGALVGAQPEVFDKIQPLLSQFCSEVEYFGEVGCAGRAKLLSNYLVFGMAKLIFETFRAAEVASVDWEQLYRVMLCGSGNSVALQRVIGQAIEGNFKGYIFNVKNTCKDLNYIAQLSEEFKEEVVLSDETRRFFESALEQGFGDHMISELLAPETRQSLFRGH